MDDIFRTGSRQVEIAATVGDRAYFMLYPSAFRFKYSVFESEYEQLIVCKNIQLCQLQMSHQTACFLLYLNIQNTASVKTESVKSTFF